MKYLLPSLAILSLLLMVNIPVNAEPTMVDFEFTTTDNEVVQLSDYYGKPILIEWAATWCTVCKNNQKSISDIYNQYKDNVTFISISFSGSDDTIEEVEQMKTERGYPWLFGLDTSGYSGSNRVLNGYNWLVDSDGTLLKTWNGTIVTSEQFASAFEEEFGFSNTLNSEGLVVGTTSEIFIITSISFFVLNYCRRKHQ